ncbi:MAG: ATP-binding cassette domain-containing protein [Merdibacter sp.]
MSNRRISFLSSINRSFNMIILSVQNVAKSFGINAVLRDVSLTIQQGERIGLVGVNGCGKSTLMRIIAGLDSQDSGEIALVRGTRIGYLAQQNMVTSGESIWNELQSVYEPVFAMEKRLRELENEMAHAHMDEQHFAHLSADYDRLMHRFEESDGYAWKSMVSGVLNGLGFKPSQYDQRVDSSAAVSRRGSASRAFFCKSPICCCWTSRPTIWIWKRCNGWKTICRPIKAAYWSSPMTAIFSTTSARALLRF